MPHCTIYDTHADKLAIFDTEPFGSQISIGRSSQCTISLKGVVNNTISGTQLLLLRTAFGWKIRNVGRASMYHNCIKVEETELIEGDVLRFGQLFFAYGALAQPSAFDLAWSCETEDGSTSAALWPGLNSVGASRDNSVTVRTPDVSRVHAFVKVDGNDVTIRGASLGNATLVNGEDIGEREVTLRPNDEIQLADTTIRLLRTVRLSQQTAPVQRSVRPLQSAANAHSLNNQLFMYLVLGVFTAVLTLLVFLALRLL